LKIDNSSIERVEEFKYLGTMLINQYSIQEEIKGRLKLEHACYYSVQNLLSSSLLSKNLKNQGVLYGCETWSLTLREERRLRMFENRVLRRVFGPKRDKVTGEWRKLHNDELSDLYSLPNIVWVVITLVWVPGHHGILGNEMADKLARQASSMPLLGPEPALGIPKCLAREAIKSWTEYQHSKTWKTAPGCRHGKLFMDGPCKKRADDLLKLDGIK
jgi:hypothetical protein